MENGVVSMLLETPDSKAEANARTAELAVGAVMMCS